MAVQKKDVETKEFDFVVVGGGLAGVCAAIAAARHGAKTAIVQDRAVFGGNSSSEIRVAPLGAASFNAWARETGILEELLLEERSRSHDDVYDGMAGSHYDVVLYEAVKWERNLTMFLNTSVRAVDAKPVDKDKPNGPRRITAVYGSQLASEKEFVFKAKQFADCTGDATVGFLAGADFRYGREARSEFNEPMAPVKADKQTMGSTLTMRARNIGHPVEFKAPEWAMKYKSLEDIGPHREPGRFNRVDYGGYWWVEIGSPYDQIADNQVIKEELLKHVLGVWDYVKNYSPEKEQAANYALEWIGMVPGKRESRRLIGDVIVTEQDCHKDRRWPDRVCYSGWFIDLHTMGGILNKKEPGEPAWSDKNYRYWARIVPFSLPLRALYSRNVVNLWMAGRNISVTHVALGSTRVMMTHSLQGQAVGTAAAYALENRLTPRQVANPEDIHIKLIQQELLKDDVNVFDMPNEDPEDIARDARVVATSEAVLDFGEPVSESWRQLDVPRGEVFPVTTDRIDSVSFYVRNDNPDAVTLTAELREIERIWDVAKGEQAGRTRVKVEGCYQGWVMVLFNAKTNPNKPHRALLLEAEGVSVATASLYPVGTVAQFLHRSPGGCEPQNTGINTLLPHETDIPKYEHWSQERSTPLAIRILPVQKPYGAANVNNGRAWPLSMPNLWMSDPKPGMPQSVELDFKKEKSFNTVIVCFDTVLCLPYHGMGAFFKAPTCARDWNLYAQVNGEWVKVYEERGNHHRRRKAVFRSVKATGLRVEVLATNAEPGKEQGVGVFEIRVYEE